MCIINYFFLIIKTQLSQGVPISRKDVGQWHEPELFLPELLPHDGVVPVQIVLPAQLCHGRKLVDLHHLVELTEVHHVAVLLSDWKRVPHCSIANIALKLSDPSLKFLTLFSMAKIDSQDD